MQIALCEDNTEDAFYLKKLIHSYCLDYEITVKIDIFETGEMFLEANKQYDLLFVDIYLKESFMDGITLCQTLRRQGNQIPIIFTTTSKLHAVDAFSIGAIHYLVKPFSLGQVYQALNRYIELTGKNYSKDEVLEINNGAVVVPVLQKNIIYIEVQNKLCTIYTAKRCYHMSASLNSIFDLLNKQMFMKAQRSYLVNMNYIELFDANKIILKNKVEIVFSRRYRSDLKKQYQNFLFSLIREDNW